MRSRPRCRDGRAPLGALGVLGLLAAIPLHRLLDPAWHGLWTGAVIVVGMSSIALGLRCQHLPRGSGLHRFVAGLAWYVSGDLGYVVVGALWDPSHPAADAFWAVGVLGIPVAIDGFRRQASSGRRRSDHEAMLDAWIVASAVAFVGWELIPAPMTVAAVRGGDLGTAGAMLFWLASMLVFGLLLSRGLATGGSTPSLWLMAAAVPLAALTSVIYWVAEQDHPWVSAPTARPLTALTYAFAAAAFWHPTLPVMFRPTARPAWHPMRLLVVAAGLAVLPVWQLALALGLADARPGDLVGGALATAVTGLAIARLRVTMRTRDDAQRAMVMREARFRSLVEHAYDGVIVVDAEFRLRWGNANSAAVTGRRVEDLLGHDAMLEVHPEDRAAVRRMFEECRATDHARVAGRCRLVDLGGGDRWIDMTMVNQLGNPAVAGVVLNYREVTDSVIARRALEHQATHDALTGLANRAMLTQAIDEMVAQDPDVQLAVLFLDLDRFKVVNDSLGHDVGDGLLVTVAGRLREVVDGCGLVVRHGGDEFVVLCTEGHDRVHVLDTAGRICAALSEPVQVGGHELSATGSVGVTFREPGQTADDMLRDADTAMYQAKARGRDGFAVFDRATRRAAERRLHLEAWLRRALAEGWLDLHYMPIVNLHTREVAGVEALLRWTVDPADDGWGSAEPTEIVQVAEESGLITPLGEWVLARACADLAALDRVAPHRGLRMSINVSGEQLRRTGLTDRVLDVLAEHDLDPSRLLIELTESVLVDDGPGALAILESLHRSGVRLAMDDFGTGFSALTNLKRIPLSQVKIDRSFVDGLHDDPEDAAIVLAIVGMAHALGLTVVAEGVETPDQEALLQQIGCDQGQGFSFSQPMGIDDLIAWLAVTEAGGDPEDRAATAPAGTDVGGRATSQGSRAAEPVPTGR